MPPQFALLLTTAFVMFLFWRDIRERPRITGALWIPLLWMLIIGSRFVSEWFGWGIPNTPWELAEGSPLDRVVFLGLELAGLYVLYRRRVSWSIVASRNIWLTIFLAYCGFSVLWSDFPVVAFKRWLKVLIHPIMALIIVTEPDPREAIVRVMKRSAYVLVPFSIVLIKYYPQLGRGFSQWTGDAFNRGVTTNKNALGYVCLLLGFFFFWHVVSTLRRQRGPGRRNELLLSGTLLGMIGWLLSKSNSATSLMALFVGISVVVLLGLARVNKRRVAAYVFVAIVLLVGADSILGLKEMTVQALGRDPTWTDRTELWDDVLRVPINPVLGSGFESFWLGPRVEALWVKYWWRPNQAHNGYLETYLNLGLLGILLLGGWIVATFRRAQDALLSDFDMGRFRMGLLAAVVLYNYAEAAFKAVHLIWFAYYIIAIDYGRPVSSPQRPRWDAQTQQSGPFLVGRSSGSR